MNVVPISLLSLSVAAIACFFALLQLAAGLLIPRYRWGLWTAGLSAAVATFSIAVFFQINARSLAQLIDVERLQMIAIAWLVFFLAGFSRSYTDDRRYRQILGAGFLALLSTGIFWGFDRSILPMTVTRDVWLYALPYREAQLGPVGITLLILNGLAGFAVVFTMFARLPRRGSSRRIIGASMGIWLLTAFNDLTGTVGLPVPYFLLEFGFLVFLVGIQALVLAEHLRLYRIIIRQRERIRKSKQNLEKTVERQTRDLRETTVELYHTLDQYRSTESILRRSMEEKEVLIKEIHHRTKNNLQVVSSLLNLTLERQVAPELRQVVRENQVRIMAMAMVHEQLYTSENVARIEFGRYLQNLVRTVAAAHRTPDCEVDVRFTVEPVFFSIEQAVPLALWANEVITNAYKHAFAGASEGTIQIELDTRADAIELSITDSGPGPGDRGGSEGLGSHLIMDLPEQVGGTILRLDPPNFGYVVSVPVVRESAPRGDTPWDNETPSLFDQ